MSLALKSCRDGEWLGRVGHVDICLGRAGGDPTSPVHRLAETVVDSLPHFSGRAAAYLDLFVDRAKACGDADEQWWLDQVDFGDEQESSQRLRYVMHFSLADDDGGVWAVEVLVDQGEHRPVRLERAQR